MRVCALCSRAPHCTALALPTPPRNIYLSSETQPPLAAPGSAQIWAEQAFGAFSHVLQATPGFRQRQGQIAMAQCVADTLSRADLGDCEDPQRAIAVIQAGTGVGKSAAYASTAIAMALQRKTRVLISTATVALQEQLMQKDLPALAASMEQPFAFALAKGRGRYVCKLKLERLVGSGGAEDDFFEDDFPAVALGTASQEALEERRFRLYEHMATTLATGRWDGDRDSLNEAPEPQDWATVAAERHSCTVRHCPRFKDCSYYQARNRLAEAQVIVANHDLVLASLGMKTLPELNNCLLVFDEAHHLPAVALDQFSSAMELASLRWLDRLPKVLQDVSKALMLDVDSDVATVSSQLKTTLTQLARRVLDLVHACTQGQDGTLRFAHGVLPEALVEPMAQVLAQATGLAQALDALGAQIKQIAKDDPMQALQCSQQYAKLGPLAPRLGALTSTASLLLEHGEQPLAKWLQCKSEGGFLLISAHACPMVPGDLLRQFVWSQARAAILTSASLTSCGSFDYFLQECGLSGNPDVQALEVSSPFDYATQGTLTVVHTMADAKNVQAYTGEVVEYLMQDLAKVEHGALVLFTSRAQMRAATDAIPARLLESVLVQGSTSRTRLLAAHMARVEAGLPSIIFGLQSFGEGLDLPGILCETVFITKLPFAPPSEPVDEARAEWLRRMGRDPFNELVIPATGIKLLQWTGRAIRTEEDRAQVICYDKRLSEQAYGRRMLQGLPPYRFLQRK
jgi:ATP-dependent DNA helicase DinG